MIQFTWGAQTDRFHITNFTLGAQTDSFVITDLPLHCYSIYVRLTDQLCLMDVFYLLAIFDREFRRQFMSFIHVKNNTFDSVDFDLI